MYSHCIIETSKGIQVHLENLETEEGFTLDLTHEDFLQLANMLYHWCENDYEPSDEFKTGDD